MTLRSCDTMVALPAATRSGQTLFAKNSDRPPDECQPLEGHPRRRHPAGAEVACHSLRLPQVRTTWRHAGSRPHWCWGYEHGFNEHQVVIGNEGLGSRIEGDGPKLLGMEILRLGLERGRTAAEALEVMTELVTRWGQGQFPGNTPFGNYDNGFLVADPREAYVLETAGHEWAVQRVERAAGISNVYAIESGWSRLSSTAQTTATWNGGWPPPAGERFNFAAAYSRPEYRAAGISAGQARRARSCAVLARHAGAIDVRLMMALLRDHSDGLSPEEPLQEEIRPGGGLCYHSEADGTGGNTAASLVADLCADGSRLPVYWCSFYSPCLGVFLPVFLEGILPPVLSLGSAEPDEASPWWRFHRLSRWARAEPETRISLLRARWATFQEALLNSAYVMAAEGRQLLDAGQAAEAARLLTEYMARCVTRILAIAGELVSSREGPLVR
jgi:dipeptidase